MSFDSRQKVVTADEAARRAREMQERGGKVVFTNGCFDLLHAGHVRYLAQARELGDMLVLGLNSDASVKSLEYKEPGRPFVPQDQRAEVAAALAAVDLVVIFDEPDPAGLIEAVAPDVLVKGGDWTPDKIVGAGFVLARGGRVESLPLVGDHSTTSLARRIRGQA